MVTCLAVHAVGYGVGVGLLAGWPWSPVGAAIGIGVAIWDELQHRRQPQVVVVTRARRG